MQAMVMTVTPQQALAWLEKNSSNRPLSLARIKQYTKDIIDGNFGLTGEAIRFFEDGALADGQHRLTAIVKACKSVETLVVFGVKKAVAPYIDTGKSRTASDVLSMFSGVNDTDARALATAVRMINKHDKGNHYASTAGGGDVTNAYIQDYYRDNENELCAAMEWVAENGKYKDAVIPRAVQIALYFLFNRANPKLAGDYLKKIIHGVGIEEKSTHAVVRDILLRDLTRTRKLDLRTKVYTVVKGFNSENKRKGISTVGGALWTVASNGEEPLIVE